MTPLVEALGFKDEKLVGVSLEALAAILKTGETLKQQEDNRINPYAHLLELVTSTIVMSLYIVFFPRPVLTLN